MKVECPNRSIVRELYVMLLVVMLIGTILRMYQLSSESLWYDEIRSIRYVKQGFLTILLRPYTIPPLYHILLKLWSGCFGYSPYSLRLLSVIFSILSIALIFKLGKVLYDERTGLYSAFLLAISPLHIFYAQETRNFSLAVFLTLLTVLSFINLLIYRRKRDYVYFSVCEILLLLTHYYAPFLVVCLNAYFLVEIKNKKDRAGWLVSQSLVAALFLPFAVMLIRNWGTIRKFGIFWLKNPPFFKTAIATLETFGFGGKGFGGDDIYLEANLIRGPRLCFYLVVAFGLCAFFIFLVRRLRKIRENFGGQANLMFFGAEGKNRRGTLLTLWLFGPTLLPLLFSIVCSPIYIIRHTIIALPAYCLLIARGISSIKRPLTRILITATILLMSFSMLLVYYTHDVKVPWNAIVNNIKGAMNTDTLIIYNPKHVKAEIEFYFPHHPTFAYEALKEATQDNKGSLLSLIGSRSVLLIDFFPRWNCPEVVSSIGDLLVNKWYKAREGSWGKVYIAYYQYRGDE